MTKTKITRTKLCEICGKPVNEQVYDTCGGNECGHALLKKLNEEYRAKTRSINRRQSQ